MRNTEHRKGELKMKIILQKGNEVKTFQNKNDLITEAKKIMNKSNTFYSDSELDDMRIPEILSLFFNEYEVLGGVKKCKN